MDLGLNPSFCAFVILGDDLRKCTLYLQEWGRLGTGRGEGSHWVLRGWDGPLEFVTEEALCFFCKHYI